MLFYLIKFSISLVLVYLFYRVVLRPLTFYQWNRFYLLCYSFLSFFIPFININPWLNKQLATDNTLINLVPSIGNYYPGNYPAGGKTMEDTQPSFLQQLTLADWMLIFFITGVMVMLVKLMRQYQSLRCIRKSAILLKEEAGVHLYEIHAPAGPFSFGNSIYINRQLHSEEELHRIIQHEFVHVKQKHTLDLMLAEFLCVINWFNPFAWFIRYSIRQNLEFIADNSVLANGLDRKEYQYLLLKVVGIPQYSIASNFNFSNLKKRITMMNKMKSAKLQLAKFLFVLPLLTVLLLAFRQTSNQSGLNENTKDQAIITGITDTVPDPRQAALAPANTYNSKGYRITIADNTGECIVLVKDKTNTIIKAITLEDWNNNKEKNEAQYGDIARVPIRQPDLPANVENIEIKSDIDKRKEENSHTATVTLKDGTKEIYNLDDEKQKEQYIKKYGALSLNPPPPPRVTPAPVPMPPPIASAPAAPSTTGVKPVTAPVIITDPILVRDTLITHPGISPLIIVDNIEEPAGFDVNSMHPEGIESITVLKDKTAAIKYGDKGKGGVILITTKQASRQLNTRKDTINRKAGSFKAPKTYSYLINGKAATKQELADLDMTNVAKTELSRKENEKSVNEGLSVQVMNHIRTDIKNQNEVVIFEEVH